MRRTLLFLFLLVAVPIDLPSTASAVSYCDGAAYLFSGTTISAFDPLAGTSTVATLPTHFNAVGATEDGFYGIARGHAFRISLAGAITDLGAIHGAPTSGFGGAFVGTIADSHWYILAGDRVFTIDLPNLDVTASVALTSAVRIGDWAAGHDGMLWTLSTGDSPTALVRVDPRLGTVTTVAHPAGLASGSTYGAVWVLGEYLYALHNGTGSVYAIDLADPSSATVAASLPAIAGAGAGLDAAACPAQAVAPSASPFPAIPPVGMPTVRPSVRPGARPSVGPTSTSAAMPFVMPHPPAAYPPAALAPVGAPPPSPPIPSAPGLKTPATPAHADVPHPVAASAVSPMRREDRHPTRHWVAAGIAVLAIGGLLTVRASR